MPLRPSSTVTFASNHLSVACACLLAATVAACGGDGARSFGGGETGGRGVTGTGGGAAGRNGATGGVRGSGGTEVGSGGASATGGRSGSGGMSTGGTMASTGGATGTGGMSAGGTGGMVDASACDQLATDYQKEMPRARMCTVGIGLSQCQAPVSAALGCSSNCITYVQDPSNLNELKRKWTNDSCDALIRFCPAIACMNGQPGNCFVSGSTTTPQCQNTRLP